MPVPGVFHGDCATLRVEIASIASSGPRVGVSGNVIICHGGSSAHGIFNSIQDVRRTAETAVNIHIREGIQELRETEALRKHFENGTSPTS